MEQVSVRLPVLLWQVVLQPQPELLWLAVALLLRLQVQAVLVPVLHPQSALR